ncbi:MAG: hypothetical protein ACREQM_16900 [Candidatus Dormibacteraceae bacterium]
MIDSVSRIRLRSLDSCLQILEDALLAGRTRVDAGLGCQLRSFLGSADLIPDHRLEGRKVQRVLDDIFDLQELVLGPSAELDVAG